MKILAIETSCDETAVALLDITGELNKPSIKVLGNALFSQAHLHEQYGGVYPTLAKREHEKNLPHLLEQALLEAREDPNAPDIDCIAVTKGPGLEPALWVGITFAEALGERWGKPVIPVDHMEGHIFSVLFKIEGQLQVPALALLVSGGHTELVLVHDFGQYEILGQTRDDAVGEAFDKVARMLGLPYPGGPEISALAQEARERGLKPDFDLPRPMINSDDLDFSYSGLKTAVLYKIKSLGEVGDEMQMKMALEFENSAVEVLIHKTRTALAQHPEVKTLIVGGGVANNSYLRQSLSVLAEESPELTLLLPDKSLTTDNAVMIGIASYIDMKTNTDTALGTHNIKADGNLELSTPRPHQG